MRCKGPRRGGSSATAASSGRRPEILKNWNPENLPRRWPPLPVSSPDFQVRALVPLPRPLRPPRPARAKMRPQATRPGRRKGAMIPARRSPRSGTARPPVGAAACPGPPSRRGGRHGDRDQIFSSAGFQDFRSAPLPCRPVRQSIAARIAACPCALPPKALDSPLRQHRRACPPGSP